MDKHGRRNVITLFQGAPAVSDRCHAVGVWGSTGIVVGGIPLSGVAGSQQALLSTIKPGNRLPGLPTPIIVMSGNKPILALATVGVSEIPEIVRVVLGSVGNRP